MNTVLTSRWTKAILFVLCLFPFLFLARGFYQAFWGSNPNALGANPIEYITHETGDWIIRLLLITLTITPLRLILKQPLLVRYRRMLGLFAFFYAVCHFSIWFALDKDFHLNEMWADVLKRRFITVGMLGLALMIPLAITSTDGWVKRLKYKRWQKLHKLVYFAAAAGVIHYYWLVKSDIRLPLMYGVILTVLLLYRWAHARSTAKPVAKPAASAARS
jgi:sulfoxide reductase heme-binding subunit YedZ